MRLRIRIVSPAQPDSRQGNRVTALRWARHLRALGHRVSIVASAAPGGDDRDHLLIALHAQRSARAVRRWCARSPRRPVIVALTGTDLYPDIRRFPAAMRAVELADRLVLLQPEAIRRLPAGQRAKARVIYQSAAAAGARVSRRPRAFEISVLSHLRHVKDPLRAAYAARNLPAHSRIRIVHAGRALTRVFAARARTEMARNLRFEWLGERSHAHAQRLLRRSRALVLSSRMEGGANVIGEAIVHGVPVLASRIDGNVGLLGRDYPALYRVGDTAALSSLLLRTETDADFHAGLCRAIRRIAPRFRPARERRAWRRLLAEFFPPGG